MFNPRPTLQVVPLHDGHACLVIDDALQDPARWRAWAVEHRGRFAPSPYAYPGIELTLPADTQAAIGDYFARHIRQRLGGRRTLAMTARLSLVTSAPNELLARQWFCHRDRLGVAPGQRLAASVIYLFDDPALGGTSIYRPRKSAAETEALVDDCNALPNDLFCARHPEIAPGYMTEGNDWFERVASVPARLNRAIFYDGFLFHSGDIRAPGRMSADPGRGRLTMNGFFTCSRRAA
jgi:hypothetical protein